MSKPLPPTGIRIPPELKGWLTQQARANMRSFNQEVLHRLQESRAKENAPTAATVGALDAK